MKRFFYALNTLITNGKITLSILLACSSFTAMAADPLQISFGTSGGSYEVCQGITFAITGFAQGGTGDYVTYDWSAAPDMLFSSGFEDIVVFNTFFTTAPGNYQIFLTVTDSQGNTGTGQVTITLKKTDRVNILTNDPTMFCEGGSALILANPSEGFDYQWRRDLVDIPDAIVSSYEATQSGSYRVRMTSDNGCSHTSTAIVITVHELPQVMATNDGPVCEGNDLQLFSSPEGAISYQWSSETNPTFSSGLPNPVIENISLAQAGTYSVMVTDANNCSNIATTSIVVNSLPQAPESAASDINEICQGSEGSLILTAEAGTGNTLNWYTGSCEGTLIGSGSPLSVPYPQTTTTYYASWSSDDCGSSACASVTVQVVPNPEVSVEVTAISCPLGNDGTATAVITGGQEPFTYLWNTGSEQSFIENLEAGLYQVSITDANGCSATGQQTLSDPEEVVIVVTEKFDVSCYEGADGAITVEASGGTAPYSYQWDNGQSGASINNLIAASYVVEVTDAAGCTKVLEVVISQPEPIDLQLVESTHVVCFGENIGAATVQAFEGEAPYTYLWSNGQTGATAENLAAGLYLVVVTDANGCTQSLEVAINSTSEIVAVVTEKQDVLCFGEATGYAIVQASGGSPGYSFLWSDGQTSYIASGLAAGEYSVIISDNVGCPTQAFVEILEPEELIITITDSMNVSCADGSDGWALAEATGGVEEYTFLWSNGQTTNMATGLSPNTYWVQVTDLHGCSAQSTVVISEPEPLELSFTDVFPVSCNNANDGQATVVVTGGSAGFSFLWDNGQTDATAVDLPPGMHGVTVTDALGCEAIAEIEITSSEPIVIGISSMANMSCFGAEDGFIQLSVTGGAPDYTYQWNTGATGALIEDLGAGTYSVTVTDQNGCTEALEVEITSPEQLLGFAGEDTPMCHPDNGGTVQLNAMATGGSGQYNWMWSPAGGLSNAAIADPMASPTATVTYTLTVSDSQGCEATSEVTITVADPLVADAGQDQTICNPENSGEATLEVNVNGGSGSFQYVWSSNTGDETLSGQENQPIISVSPQETTIYTVVVTDLGAPGCTSSASVTVNVNEPLTVSAGETLTACDPANGAGIQLQGVVSGGSGSMASVVWSPSEGLDNPGILNPLASPEMTTLYTLTVTDNQGCVASDQVLVEVQPALFADAGPDMSSCYGIPVMLGGLPAAWGGSQTGYSYQWTPSQGLDDPTASNPMVYAPTQSQTYTLTVTDGNGCVAMDETTISISSQVIANAGADQVVCKGSPVTLGEVPAATGGQPPYLYYWWIHPNIPVSSQPNPTIIATTTSEYHLTVSDMYGCFSGATTLITVDQPVEASAGEDQTICPGEMVSLNATGGSSYLWDTGETSASIEVSPLETTTYSVMVTNGCGTKPASVTVFVEQGQWVDLGDDLNICGSDPVVIDAGLHSNSTYLWSTGSIQQTISVSEAGVYSVRVTNTLNGCYSDGQIEVFIELAPGADAGEDKEICSGEEVMIGPLEYEPAPEHSFSWVSAPLDESISDPGILNPTVSPLETTTYTLTVTNTLSGCSSQMSMMVVVLTAPQALVADEQLICEGGQVNLGLGEPIAGYTYQWESVPAGFDSNEHNPLVSPLVSTQYTLTVENQQGCKSMASVLVQVNATPRPGLSEDILFCSPLDVTPVFIGGASISGITYEWTSQPEGFFSESANPMVFLGTLNSISYFLKTTSEAGCEGRDTVVVSVSDFMVSSASSPMICSDVEELQLGNYVLVSGGTAPYEYQWLTPQGELISQAFNPTITAPFEDYYQFVVYDAWGCIQTINLPVELITIPEVVIQTSPAGAAFIGQTVTYRALPEGYDNYEFMVDGQLVQTGPSNIYVSGSLKNGQEISVVVNNQGCYFVSPATLAIIGDLPNAFTPDGDGINDIFGKGYDLVIFNRWGQGIYEGTDGWDGTHNGKYASPGTYYYIMNAVDANNVKKVLKGSVTLVRSRN